MVVSASAWVRRVVAATCGHLRWTYLQANSYQEMSPLALTIEIGRPDAMSNASPLLAAESSWERKLPASARFLNGSLRSLPATRQQT